MKDRTIFALKGVAIAGVLLHHIQNRKFSAEITGQLNVLSEIFAWCVLLFIATSGWLHGASEEKKGRTIRDFILNRCRRLLLPFLLLIVLYAAIRQGLQLFGLQDGGGRISPRFITKVLESFPFIPGVPYNPVAGQLYFLPLLFVISCVTHTVHVLFDARGVLACSLLSLSAGVYFTPDAPNTGFSLGMILFGLFCYSAGFAMYRWRAVKNRSIGVVLISVAVVCVLGLAGLPKVVPLLLLECMYFSRLGSVPLLDKVGEASGTIYAYHSPFILNPLIILVTRCPKGFQLIGVVAAVIISIAMCTYAFDRLRATPFKWALL